MTDLTEQWVNIYKSKKHESYWTGAFCYKTKEEAVKDLADKENYLTTVNIEDMLNLQTQNAQLKEQINKCYLDAINRGTANTVKAVKEFGMPERIEELVKENAQLKELLKLARSSVDYHCALCREYTDGKILITKIEEVLKCGNIK